VTTSYISQKKLEVGQDIWQGNLYNVTGVLTWQELDSVNIPIIAALPVTNWVQLDSRSISVIPVVLVPNWVQLDSRSISVTSAVAVTNWVQLNQASISIVPTEKAGWQKYIPWVAGAGAVGLAIYAIKKSQED